MHGTKNIDLQAMIEQSIHMDLIIGAWLSNLKDITRQETTMKVPAGVTARIIHTEISEDEHIILKQPIFFNESSAKFTDDGFVLIPRSYPQQCIEVLASKISK